MMAKERKNKKTVASSCLSRLDVYKTYKLLCKLLGCEAICYGPLTKKMADSGQSIVYASRVGGEKFAVAKLIVDRQVPSLFRPGSRAVALTLRKLKSGSSEKTLRSQDLQKQIVLRILKALEDHDVTLITRGYGFQPKILKKGMDFESLLLMEDLVR